MEKEIKCKKCDKSSKQVLSGDTSTSIGYCEDHFKKCDHNTCEDLASEIKYCELGEKRKFRTCPQHSENFDIGEDIQFMNCNGSRCRKRISIYEHRLFCTACHYDYNPFWKYEEEI